MRKLFAIVGIVSLLGPSVATASLYEHIEEIVLSERQLDKKVSSFIASALSKEGRIITATDVENVFKGNTDEMCQRLKLDAFVSCAHLIEHMRLLREREEGILKLGHELQGIASSYEEPIIAFSQQPEALRNMYENVLRTWGIRDVMSLEESSRSVRIIPYPTDGSLDGAVGSLRAAMEALAEDKESLISSVWRYQYGVDFVQSRSQNEDPDGASGPGTERQYIFARFDGRASRPDLERALVELKDVLSGAIDPPLHDGEVGLIIIPSEKLIDNVAAWVYARDPGNSSYDSLPLMDAGLTWDDALEPIAPSLVGDGIAILAGKYPPRPVEEANGEVLSKGGGGLCLSLSGSQGYLCRTRPEQGTEECEDIDPEEDTIILTSCSDAPSAISSGTGSDVCHQIYQSATGGEEACSPGSQAEYPYTILGHTCFLRECAERTYGHRIVPGRDPLVSQESAYPWNACIAFPSEEEALKLPPSITTLPFIPAYNPALRMRELDMQYCQIHGQPPLSPPAICEPKVHEFLARQQTTIAGNALKAVGEADNASTIDLLSSMEAMGVEIGAELYKDYLRQGSLILNNTFSTTVELLERLANKRFPETMCPLDPTDAVSLCPTI